jgi:hypothetical protein
MGISFLVIVGVEGDGKLIQHREREYRSQNGFLSAVSDALRNIRNNGHYRQQGGRFSLVMSQII